MSLARLSLALARSAPRSASVHPAIPDPSHDRHTPVTQPSANRHTTVRDLRAQRKLPRAHAHAPPDPSANRHTTATRPSADRHTTVRDLRAQRKLPRAHAHAAHAHHSDRRSAARMGASNEDPNTRFLVRSGPAATRAHTTRAMSPCCSCPRRGSTCVIQRSPCTQLPPLLARRVQAEEHTSCALPLCPAL